MISGDDFAALQKLLQDRAGMALTSDKLYLVAARLGPVAQTFNLRSVLELMQALRTRPSERLITAVVEAMVTHESLFFRDGKPFDQLRAALPELVRARNATRTIRIWSAACSSGQEAYSVAMLIAEECGHLPAWRWDIVGTDISQPIIEKARAGLYSAFEVRRGLDEGRIARHFQMGEAQSYKINEPLRRMTQFRFHNLVQSAAHLGLFDVIFCRNVLIYFDAPTKARALDLMARQLAPDGLLFLGSADSVQGLSSLFLGKPEDRGLYRLAKSPFATTA